MLTTKRETKIKEMLKLKQKLKQIINNKEEIKMQRNKSGISLITLVITIIIMIILAGAIILSLTQSGIFDKANEATGKYNLQQVQAIADLAWAEVFADGERNVTKLQEAVDEALKSNELDDKYEAIADEKGVVVTEKVYDPVGDATVNQKTDENSTIDGKPYSATNPIIPKGFIPINTETSKWDEGAIEDNVKKGLVISDENGNEFVWIPVKNIKEMAKAYETTEDGTINYEGVLYDYHYYDEDGIHVYEVAQERENYGQDTGENKEPAKFIGTEWTSSEDFADRFTIQEIKNNWNENYYQHAFNKMVKSVAKYKGFYIGRYEMSIDASGKAQSKAGQTSSTPADSNSKMWWGLYEKATTYSNSEITSEMIWGCQYNAMLRWMQENSIDVSCYAPIDTARNKKTSENTTGVTGANVDDILNNIYDVVGGKWEWTQEAIISEYDECRMVYALDGIPGTYEILWPPNDKTDTRLCTRLTMYIPVTD